MAIHFRLTVCVALLLTMGTGSLLDTLTMRTAAEDSLHTVNNFNRKLLDCGD